MSHPPILPLVLALSLALPAAAQTPGDRPLPAAAAASPGSPWSDVDVPLETAQSEVAAAQESLKTRPTLPGAAELAQDCKDNFSVKQMTDEVSRDWIAQGGLLRAHVRDEAALGRLIDEARAILFPRLTAQELCVSARGGSPNCGQLRGLASFAPDAYIEPKLKDCEAAGSNAALYSFIHAAARRLPDAAQRCQAWQSSKEPTLQFRKDSVARACAMLVADFARPDAFCAKATAGSNVFQQPMPADKCLPEAQYLHGTGPACKNDPRGCEVFALFMKNPKADDAVCKGDAACLALFDDSAPLCGRQKEKMASWYCGLLTTPAFKGVVKYKQDQLSTPLDRMKSQSIDAARARLKTVSDALSQATMAMAAHQKQDEAWKQRTARLKKLQGQRDELDRALQKAGSVGPLQPPKDGKAAPAPAPQPGAPPPGKP